MSEEFKPTSEQLTKLDKLSSHDREFQFELMKTAWEKGKKVAAAAAAAAAAAKAAELSTANEPNPQGYGFRVSSQKVRLGGRSRRRKSTRRKRKTRRYRK